ncbi:unnamed protein product [Rotaria sordida]|uniref:Uncharacterized protein n=1 Tax=Rotaria sordida TaxID=392033 RepID=A0A815MX85_9BILA|nr:unnamed protein product [Rotaria sordida]CAF1630343.1 unnamed protein product [Rotaria sordida]
MTSYYSKSSSTSSKSSATTKSYGNGTNFNCFIKIRRLSIADIRKACYPLGELPKIPFKTYMEKQKEREKIEQSTKNNSRSPILTSHLADGGRRKSTIEEVTNTKSLSPGSATSSLSSSNSSKTLSKRKRSPDYSNEKAVNETNNGRREMMMALARTFETLVDTDSTLDSMESQDDLRNWCVTKVLRTMEQHQAKKNENKADDRHS